MSPVGPGGGRTVGRVEDLGVVEGAVRRWRWRRVQDLKKREDARQRVDVGTGASGGQFQTPAGAGWSGAHLRVEGSLGGRGAAGRGPGHMVAVVERSSAAAAAHQADGAHHGLPTGDALKGTALGAAGRDEIERDVGRPADVLVREAPALAFVAPTHALAEKIGPHHHQDEQDDGNDGDDGVGAAAGAVGGRDGVYEPEEKKKREEAHTWKREVCGSVRCFYRRKARLIRRDSQSRCRTAVSWKYTGCLHSGTG